MDYSLPDAIFIELGKFTWAAILLEDLTDSLCSFVRHTNPREDRRSIGQKIKDARRDLRSWNPSSDVDQVDAWLVRASRALERRNAMLHSVPLTVIDRKGQRIGYALGELPRSGRDYFERHLTVNALREAGDELHAAQQGWRKAVQLADEHHP